MKNLEISNEHATLISEAVKKSFGTDSWEIAEIMVRGLSQSAVYKITINGNSYVSKLSDPNHPHNNLKREYHAIAEAAKNNVAPEVYYADPDSGTIIMAYVPVISFDNVGEHDPNMINKFSTFIRRLHGCNDFQNDDSVFRRVEIIYSQLPEEVRNNKLLKQAIEISSEIQKYLDDPHDLRPCHTDLNPYNVLFDGKDFCLVDWQVAVQESFYFDLASCVTFFYFLSDTASNLFLTRYFERSLHQDEKDKFYLMQTFVFIYYGIFFIYGSVMQETNLLSEEKINSLPSYSQYMKSIGDGEVNLSDPIAQQEMGFIYLKMAMSAYQDTDFASAIERLR